MVSDDLERDVLLRIFAINDARYLRGVFDDGKEQIRLEVRLLILQHGSQSLKTASRINILVLKRIVLTVFRAVELRKDEIPDFEVTITITANSTVRAAAAALFAKVDVDFRIRTARAGADLPEVVIEFHDMILWEAGLLAPDGGCFIVLRIDRDPKLFLRQIQDIRQELPRPGNRLFFEIVSKREVAEHFKIRLMTRRASDVLDISRTYAALARRDARARRLHLARKERFERRHARADHQERWIVCRDERSARQSQMPLFLRKELQIRFAQFISCHVFQKNLPPSEIPLNADKLSLHLILMSNYIILTMKVQEVKPKVYVPKQFTDVFLHGIINLYVNYR